MKKGLVFRSTGSWYSVQSEGIFYACRIKGRLRLRGIKSTNPVAVGDWVGFEEVPNSTSSITYGLNIKSANGNNVAVQPNGGGDGTGRITLMEVLA